MGKGKGHTIGLKTTSMESDQSAHFCNRIGCNGRIKYGTLNTRNGSSEKATNPSFSSSNRNEIGASRSKGSFLDSKRKLSLRLGFDPSGSGRSSKSEVSSSSKNLAKHRLAFKNETSGEIKPRKGFHHKSELKNQNTPLVFSAPSSSKSSSLSSLYNRSTRSSSSSNINRNNSYSKNNSSISSSNSSTSGSSSGFYSSSSSKNVMKNKNHGAKNPPPGRLSGHPCPSASGTSISASGSSSPASGDSKTATRRPVNASTSRLRLSSSHRNGRIHSSTLNIGGPRSDASRPSSSWSSCSFSGANPENQPDLIPFTTDELDITHLMNNEQYNMDGIAEQVLALETDFYLDGLDFYDRHRDMRLDIDNMSYEELLALEERMGTVSTALSGEALSECIKTSIYEAGPPGARLVESRDEGDGLKCSICQEEYMAGEEIGQLVACLHEYHETCIYQWLQLKNWCPICKVALKE